MDSCNVFDEVNFTLESDSSVTVIIICMLVFIKCNDLFSITTRSYQYDQKKLHLYFVKQHHRHESPHNCVNLLTFGL